MLDWMGPLSGALFLSHSNATTYSDFAKNRSCKIQKPRTTNDPRRRVSLRIAPANATVGNLPYDFVTANRKLGFSGSNDSRSNWSVPRERLIIQMFTFGEFAFSVSRSSIR